MGYQTRETIDGARGRAGAARSRAAGALLVASTDLSHYFDARDRGRRSTARVQAVRRGIRSRRAAELFEQYPEHERGRYVACGGGPAIAVMMAARALGATPRAC